MRQKVPGNNFVDSKGVPRKDELKAMLDSGATDIFK